MNNVQSTHEEKFINKGSSPFHSLYLLLWGYIEKTTKYINYNKFNLKYWTLRFNCFQVKIIDKISRRYCLWLEFLNFLIKTSVFFYKWLNVIIKPFWSCIDIRVTKHLSIFLVNLLSPELPIWIIRIPW